MKSFAFAIATTTLLGAGLVVVAQSEQTSHGCGAARGPPRGARRARPHRAAQDRPGPRQRARDPGGRASDRARDHLLRHLPQRAGQGRRAVAGQLQCDEGAGTARGHREDDPQAARRHDAAGRLEAARHRHHRRPDRRPRIADGRTGLEQPEPGLAAVPAPQPRRVRHGRQEPRRPRHRRLVAPAARHAQQRLRQRGRRAGLLAGADGRLPARRRPHRHPGPRRPELDADRGHLQGAAHAVADGAHRGHAGRDARRRLARPRVPGRRRIQLPRHVARHSDRAALRQHGARTRRSKSRSTARAWPCSTSTRG